MNGEYIKLRLLEPYGLIAAGQSASFQPAMAAQLIADKIAEPVDKEAAAALQDAGSSEVATTTQPTTGDLPDDFPGKELLVAGGISTFEELAQNLAGLSEQEALAYLQQFEGIGPATASKIYAAAPKPE